MPIEKQEFPKINESRTERLENARMVFRDFLEIKPGEKVLFLIDDSSSTDRNLIDVFKEQLAKENIEFTELKANIKTSLTDVEKLLAEYGVIWASCNWDKTGIDFYALADKLLETRARMADSGGVTVEALDNTGALAEKREDLEWRLGRMGERVRDATGFYVRTWYGTDLTVRLRPREERIWHEDAGVIEPGYWDNLPGGEIYTTPDEEKINGILMLPVLQDEITREQGVDKFVQLTIRNGKIAKIDGGASAEKLRRYLQKHSKYEEEPLSVIQCSEIAFGANEKAQSKASSPLASYKKRGTGVLEAEKRLGTMHVAFGSSKHGEPGTEGHTESNVHIDFVIPRLGLSVTMFKSHEDFIQKKNGEKLIDEGRWRFI